VRPQQIAPGVHLISLGVVNAYLIDGDELALIDTGTAASAQKIVEAIRDHGREPSDLRHILVTHSHPDHSGSLAALKRLTGAAAYMHPLAAAVVRGEEAGRPLHATPGLLNGILFRAFIPRPPWSIPATQVEHEILDGDIIPVGGGIRAIHVPGHCAGQLAFHIMRGGGVLLAADTAANMTGLNLMPGYEDVETGRRSLAKLAGFHFEVAGFGHGAPILQGAADRFRKKWGANTIPPRGSPSATRMPKAGRQP
jgi:glyoxylase-like metal-dependent hydrolase (beta-lactamase superfamily II)